MAEVESRTFFTIGKKRQNVLGEGFEDLLVLLLGRVSMVPAGRIRVRTAVTDLPGFQRASRVPVLGRSERVPRPDIAIINDTHTNAIITAKWSMRQDREMQFVHEYSAYEKLKLQSPALRFYLITNEFDVARLDNVARAQPDTRGYIFHTIYHVSSELLRETQGSQVGAVDGWITAGKIASLSDFLHEMAGSYGTAPAQQDRTRRRPRGAR